MSENETGNNQGNNADQEGSSAAAFSPIETQEQLNKIVERRLQRERAKFADYEELKGKAAKLEELEAAGKTELEKAIEKSAKAEAELKELKAEIALGKAKTAIAEEFGIAEAILRGSTEAELREHAEAIKANVSLYPNTKDKGEGNKSPDAKATKNEFVANLFGKD